MKYLFYYSFKNITRNRKRTFLTLFGIMIAVAFLILSNSLVNGLLNQVLEVAVKNSGNIVVQSKDYARLERLMPLDKGIDDLKTLMAELAKMKDVAFASPRVNLGGLFVSNDESYTAAGTAVDPVVEKDFLRLENNIVAGSYFTGETNEVIIGTEIARRMGYKPGDYALFVSKNSYNSIAAMRLRVAGIADFGMYDLNRTFYIDLKSAYRLLKIEDYPQKVIVALKNKNRADAVKRALLKSPFIVKHDLRVFKADETGIFQSVFVLVLGLFRFVMALFLLAAMIIIMNTMMMTVMERTPELGVLQAMGMKREKAVLAVVLEGAAMGLIGGLLGASFAAPLAWYLMRHGIVLGENLSKGMPIAIKNVVYPEASVSLVLVCVLFGIVISILASLAPALLRVKRLNIAEAIRQKNA